MTILVSRTPNEKFGRKFVEIQWDSQIEPNYFIFVQIRESVDSRVKNYILNEKQSWSNISQKRNEIG